MYRVFPTKGRRVWRMEGTGATQQWMEGERKGVRRGAKRREASESDESGSTTSYFGGIFGREKTRYRTFLNSSGKSGGAGFPRLRQEGVINSMWGILCASFPSLSQFPVGTSLCYHRNLLPHEFETPAIPRVGVIFGRENRMKKTGLCHSYQP